MDETPLAMMLKLINEDKLSELEAERLFNAASRYLSGVPTGTTRSITNSKHTP